jgi:hypothetical protein
VGDHDVCPSCGGESLEPALPGCARPLFNHPPVPKPEPVFPVHTIVVTKVAYDDPVFFMGIDPSEIEYGIGHGECTLRGEECIVESIVSDLGLHSAIFGVFDTENRLEVRDYQVRGWTSKYDVPSEPIEYDAGIELVDDEDDDG